ncbi:MAG TPA: 7-cyano-7-deazaguanine synthase [Candidatus Thermoplasmatota archaeon]|nr:7-cyano-7-deazaguanine synthase [Candidatus Thermoplasmatota archaeon]
MASNGGINSIVIIPWSSGIDSTGLIFKAHKENRKIHAHFIEMHQERFIKHIYESKHVEMLRSHIYKNYFHFDFSRSVFDLSLCPSGTRFWSEEVELVIVARLAVHFSGFFKKVEVWDGRIKEDDTNPSMTKRFSRRSSSFDFLKSLTWEIDNVELKTPFKDVSKKDIWNDILPEDVRKLTFSCNQPLLSGTCGKCKNCIDRRRIIK